MVDPSAPIAFAAGLVSFLSPCVLPLVPGYLSYMSGMGASGNEPVPRRVVLPALAFVAGFTLVFVALGATATLLGSLLRDYKIELARVGGVVIILLGLVFMDVIRVPFLSSGRRLNITPKAGMWGSAVLGAAFAFGWSPCIGATMGAVLTMAAGRGASGDVGEGALLLAIYSLGLGVPFVLAGIGIGRMTTTLARLRRHIRAINLASGVVLVAVGVLFVSGQLFRLSAWMQKSLTSVGLDFWTF